MTEADALFHDLERHLLGRRVRATRVFLFTLQIYLEPSEPNAPDLQIWCEPSWLLRAREGVVTGSGAIEGPSTFDDADEIARADATIARASAAAKVLVGHTLNALLVDAATHALVAHFSNGIVAETFLDDPATEALWVINDPHRQLAIRGTPRGLAVGSRERVV